MKKVFMICSIAFAFLATAVISQEITEEQILQDIAQARIAVRQDVKAVVGASMHLTREEGSVFWPVYETYNDEMDFINDSLLALIQTYAQYYNDSMNSDVVPSVLIEDYLAIEKRRVEVRQEYLDQFRQVLPEEKVVLFYQIDNRIHNLMLLGLQQQVPLILE